MTKILGIDFGLSKIGLAVSEGILAEPLKVLRFNTTEDALVKIVQLVEMEEIEVIVVGISEGEMGKKSKEFGEILKKKLKIKVDYQDETLTTYTAQELSRDAGIGRKKRREMEDAYSAALILQSYIDLH